MGETPRTLLIMSRTITPERQRLKDAAVRLASRENSASAIARQLGINERQVRRWISGHNNGHNKVSGKMSVHYSSLSPEWKTPEEIIARVIDVLGSIDLDPCADDERHVPAKAHFTKRKDGLSRYWFGRIFMNPPYGRTIGQWLGHLLREYHSGRTIEAIALVPARTETQWMQVLHGYPMCFIRGRLRFSDNANGAPFPSAIVYFGENAHNFVGAFECLGAVHIPQGGG